MRNLLTIISILFALPAFAARPITADQLQQFLASAHGKTDADLAYQIAELHLTERLSSVRLSAMQMQIPGDKSKVALSALADESQFQMPPSAEIPVKPIPDTSQQRRIMGLVANYIKSSIPQLPNFIATRTTERFEDTPLLQGSASMQSSIAYQPLHPVGKSNATVLYRDGLEVVDANGDHTSKQKPALEGLTTWGVFGPILGSVLVDAAASKLAWSHWEQGTSGLSVVFEFNVPQQKSHYEVNYCCVATQAATASANIHPFRRIVAYHGSMSVDPSSGVIVRLIVEADLKATDPVTRAAVLVDYGPVEIGGRSYTCPLRSISSTIAQSVQLDPVYKFPLANQLQPLKTALNEDSFDHYHVFRADVRVLSQDEADLAKQALVTAPSPGIASAKALQGSEDESAAEVQPGTQSGSPCSSSTPPSSAVAITTPPPALSSATPESTSAPISAAKPVSPLAKSEQPPTPKISVTAGTRSSDLPSSLPPAVPPESGFHLRTTSRLVEVSVVAFDKKGRPVTDFKPGDLDIYDNGRKQAIGFLSQPHAEGAYQSPSQPVAQDPEPAQQSLTNLPANPASSFRVKSSPSGDTTVFLIDSSHVAFGDLTYARSEMLRFLKTVADDEPIGLYILRKSGLQILKEPTLDHNALAATLSKWMPSAHDLAQAQDEEQHNRQQFEFVHSVADLVSVNGNGEGGSDPEMVAAGNGQGLASGSTDLNRPPDAKLRSMGDNPEREALFFLQGVARHLAALPGHKTLVWVASDNVLADWQSQAVGKADQGGKFLDQLALHAREALNEAHVSIYPLDASQLEAGGISADIGTRNVLAMGKSDRDKATEIIGDAAPGMKPGRTTAQMHQDTHPIQPTFRELAEATGGRALRRAGDIAAELDSVVNDGRAAYLLGFTPDTAPDGAYHHITVKLANRRDITLRYRTGYLYAKEPATLKERFQQAVWQPADIGDIGLGGISANDTKPQTFTVKIVATDLALEHQGEFWTDTLDIFLIERDDAAQRAKLNRQSVSLRLRPASYQTILRDGLSIELPGRTVPETGALRVIVADENSGRMGTVTIPASVPNGPS